MNLYANFPHPKLWIGKRNTIIYSKQAYSDFGDIRCGWKDPKYGISEHSSPFIAASLIRRTRGMSTIVPSRRAVNFYRTTGNIQHAARVPKIKTTIFIFYTDWCNKDLWNGEWIFFAVGDKNVIIVWINDLFEVKCLC